MRRKKRILTVTGASGRESLLIRSRQEKKRRDKIKKANGYVMLVAL